MFNVISIDILQVFGFDVPTERLMENFPSDLFMVALPIIFSLEVLFSLMEEIFEQFICNLKCQGTIPTS
jgi:hypothetical protein